MKRRELLTLAAGLAVTSSGVARGAIPKQPLSLDDLYSARLLFDDAGKPRIPIGMMERQRLVRFSSGQGFDLLVGGQVIKVGPSISVSVEVEKSTAAEVATGWVIGTLEGRARAGRRSELKRWQKRGLAVRMERAGGVYGMRGTVVDNRAALMVMAKEPTLKEATTYDLRPAKMLWLRHRPTAQLAIRVENKVYHARDLVEIRPRGADGFVLAHDVEHSIGYPQHGFSNMELRGVCLAVVDPEGKLALVNVVGENECVAGVLPREMFPNAPLEALKAQAVTARGEVYAKIGRRHLVDPYLVCSSQHCQVYRGKSAEQPRTNQAARASAGELAFHSGQLVDSVYSACCGGHTEPAHIVWDRPAKASLRGIPDSPFADPATQPWRQPAAAGALVARDLLPRAATEAIAVPIDLSNEDAVRSFLALPRDKTFCGRSSFNQRTSIYRWETSFRRRDLDAIFADLGVGEVRKIEIKERGPGGRLRALLIEGSLGKARVLRELPVRKRLKRGRKILKSGLFVIDEERDAAGALLGVTLRGAGNGHGSGMCQQGAIGMAESGYTYAEILRHYYGGAQVRAVF